jgi:hypothetical protein
MSRGIGIVQEQVLRVVELHEPISIAAVRSKIYPSDWNTNKARATVSRAVSALVRRHCLIRDDGEPGKPVLLCLKQAGIEVYSGQT